MLTDESQRQSAVFGQSELTCFYENTFLPNKRKTQLIKTALVNHKNEIKSLIY